MHGSFAASALPQKPWFIAAAPFERNRPLKLSPDAMWRLVNSVVQGGGERLSLHRHRVNWAGNCERPVWFDANSPGERKLVSPSQIPGFAPPTGDPHRKVCVHRVEMAVRCRTCAACLRARCNEWTARAAEECRVAARTWFCTYTVKPGKRYLYREAARVRLKKAGVSFDKLPRREQFGELCRELGRDHQKYLKVLRRHGAKFRYLAVFEAHKSGEPHMHVLMHELESGTLSEKALRTGWSKVGFAQAKLVHEEAGGVRYVTKYIAKDVQTRVRSSRHYGRPLVAMAHRLGLIAGCKPVPVFRWVPPAEQANDVGLAVAEAEAALERRFAELAVSSDSALVKRRDQSALPTTPVYDCWESQRIEYYRRLVEPTPSATLVVFGCEDGG